MSLYADAVSQPSKVLNNLLTWLDKAEAHATELDFDVENLMGARLAPDQFPLTRQVLAACDSAKFAATRPAGITPPTQQDTETTLEEVRARIKATLEIIDAVTEDQYEGAAERIIELRFLPEGKAVRADDYIRDFALPNMYFHATTAYAILRHNGVKLGKREFIGKMTLQDV